jgi:hypothetical protein
VIKRTMNPAKTELTPAIIASFTCNYMICHAIKNNDRFRSMLSIDPI